jgi:hypothetical protein
MCLYTYRTAAAGRRRRIGGRLLPPEGVAVLLDEVVEPSVHLLRADRRVPRPRRRPLRRLLRGRGRRRRRGSSSRAGLLHDGVPRGVQVVVAVAVHGLGRQRRFPLKNRVLVRRRQAAPHVRDVGRGGSGVLVGLRGDAGLAAAGVRGELALQGLAVPGREVELLLDLDGGGGSHVGGRDGGRWRVLLRNRPGVLVLVRRLGLLEVLVVGELPDDEDDEVHGDEEVGRDEPEARDGPGAREHGAGHGHELRDCEAREGRGRGQRGGRERHLGREHRRRGHAAAAVPRRVGGRHGGGLDAALGWAAGRWWCVSASRRE